jgi:histidinol-phosphate aminotransferase
MDFKAMMPPHLRNVKPYVPGKPIEEVRREKNFAGEIHKLASNENPYPPAREIQQAIIDEVKQLNRYPNSGSYYVCRDLAEKYNVKPDQIFVGNGSNEIIDLLVRAFINPGEEIIYPIPSFIIYPIEAQLAGVKAVEVPLRNYRLDLEAMRSNITRKTKIVFICNPNNPTGTYVTAREVERFFADLRSDALIVFDEAYFEYVDADDYPNTLEMLRYRPNIIILRTFSKLFSLSGCRIGYSISHPDLVTCLHKVRQPFNVNRIAQAAARAALKHSDSLGERLDENREQISHLRDGLLNMGFVVPPSQTNFLLVVPTKPVGDIVEKLMDRGIIVRPMKPFGLGEESFRVTVGTPEENKKFLKDIGDLL